MIAPEVFAFASPVRVARAAAETVVETLRAALAARGQASLVLTGGSTPGPLYRLLAASYPDALDWEHVHVFWGDERHVPHDHDDSNARFAREALLDGLAVPDAQVYPVPTGGTPEADARAYEQTLRAYFGDEATPAFDLVLLGMGGDGHVASLFPDSPSLGEAERWVVATEAPPASPVRDRISLTFPALGATRTVLFLVTGAGKAEAVASVFSDPGRTPPAGRVGAQERLLWFLDDDAHGGTA
ncbi:MAG: 6-phosphogluconolactonase [Bacteroidota bacterium]